MSYVRQASEKNGATITTNATGAGTFTATQLQQVDSAMLSSNSAGYVVAVTSTSGQTVSFQVYQSAGTAAAFAKPTVAVSFDPNTITALEYGY